MIYFIQEGTEGPIKIGYTSKSVRTRMATLQTASAQKLRLLATAEGTQKDESMLHARFSACHIKGEWFKPSVDLMNYIFPVPKIDHNKNDGTEIRQSYDKISKEIENMAWERGYSLDYLIFNLLDHELKRWKDENKRTHL